MAGIDEMQEAEIVHPASAGWETTMHRCVALLLLLSAIVCVQPVFADAHIPDTTTNESAGESLCRWRGVQRLVQ